MEYEFYMQSLVEKKKLNKKHYNSTTLTATKTILFSTFSFLIYHICLYETMSVYKIPLLPER